MKNLLFFLFLSISASANTQTHHEFWSKVSITHPFQNNWSAEVDLIHRRQANFLSGQNNMFQFKLVNSIRTWVFYKLNKNWQIISSPVSMFTFDDLMNYTGELKEKKEIRTAIGVSKSYHLGSISNKNRFIAEERFIEFNRNDGNRQTRFRFLTAFGILFSKEDKLGFSYQVSDEIITRLSARYFDFDQNRLLNSIHWKKKRSDIEVGYQFVLQKGKNGLFYNNQLLVGIYYTI